VDAQAGRAFLAIDEYGVLPAAHGATHNAVRRG
jgi:hypothetical protein